jgi:iron complex transport system ATP-binding protein
MTEPTGALSIINLTCGYDAPIIESLSLEVAPGDTLCILGKNGIGKTTLFRTLLGTLKPLGGTVTLAGCDLFAMTAMERAKQIAYVPQTHNPPFAYTAFDIVLMGRAGRMSAFSVPSAKDKTMAAEAMDLLGIAYLAARPYTQVSGGERQMILIARAVAQGAGFLFLDEPAANLDYGNQMKVLGVLKDLASVGKGVIFTSHDPGHAFLLRAKVAAVRAGNDIVIGKGEDIVTKDMAQSLYGVRAEIVTIEDLEKGQDVKVFAPFLD